MPRAAILDVRILNSDAAYYGWPTVARTRAGTLYVACSGGRQEHVCPFGKLQLFRSDDQGRSWSGPRTLADTPLDDRDAGILETRHGTLLVNWFNSVTWMNYLYRQETGQIDWLHPDTQRHWRAVRERLCEPSGLVRRELGDWLIRSEDGGQTWSPRIPTVVNSPHGPIELADGHLLYAGKQTTPPAQWNRGSPHENAGIGVAESADDGRSWQWLAPIPVAPGHTPADYHELHVVETADRRLVAQIRNHGTPWKDETIQTESADNGRTWSVPHSIDVWGTPSHLLRLRDGRLLMTYGYRRPPFGNQARVSTDGGTTWSAPLTLSADGEGADLGYPSSVELDNGSLLSVWYEKLAGRPHAVLRQARWELVEG